MISLLVYFLTNYDIFETVKNISSGRDKDYPLWEKVLVQIAFTFDVFIFVAMFLATFIYSFGDFNP